MEETNVKEIKLKPDQKISKETAEGQIDFLMKYYDIDQDDIKNERQENIYDKTYRKLTKAIQEGLLEIKNEDETPIVYQYLKKPPQNMDPQIRYREISGQAKVAMKGIKEEDAYNRLYAFLGGLSGLGSNVFTKLKGRDLGIAEYLAWLFLQV